MGERKDGVIKFCVEECFLMQNFKEKKIVRWTTNREQSIKSRVPPCVVVQM